MGRSVPLFQQNEKNVDAELYRDGEKIAIKSEPEQHPMRMIITIEINTNPQLILSLLRVWWR